MAITIGLDFFGQLCLLVLEESLVEQGLVVLSGLLATGMAVITVVFWARLFYRSWAVIQDGDRVRTTPGLAVGLNFVPIFNCYWVFISQVGLAQGMNDYCQTRGIQAPQVSEELAIANSCMVLVMYLLLPFQIAFSEPGDHGMFLMNMVVSLGIYLFCLLLDFLLYRQYAEVAEAIQEYKVSQTINPERMAN